MDKKNDIGARDRGSHKGRIYVIGIGPGGLEHLTDKARRTIASATCIVGYTRYVDLIGPLITGKLTHSTGMTGEVERCEKAVELARMGEVVAVISSGDSGIYAMAGLVFEIERREKTGVTIEVVPGVPAFVSAAAILGAPLMHDFASISLSDLLTERDLIERRVQAAASADFVIVLYNPKSTKRIEGLGRAIDIIRKERSGATPVGIVRNATREDEGVILTTLDAIDAYYDKIDMLTILIVGNSTTFTDAGRMITPRGYKEVCS